MCTDAETDGEMKVIILFQEICKIRPPVINCEHN